MTWAFGTTSPVSCPVSARPCQSLTGDAMSLWHGSGMKMYGTGCVHQKGEPSRARADGSHPHARQRETGTHLARCRRAHRGNDDRVRCWATSDLVLASSRLPTTEPYLHAAAAPSVLGDRPATRMGRRDASNRCNCAPQRLPPSPCHCATLHYAHVCSLLVFG